MYDISTGLKPIFIFMIFGLLYFVSSGSFILGEVFTLLSGRQTPAFCAVPDQQS